MTPSDERFDAIVVGGGISGLVTAYELQKRGCNVLLVDAGAVSGGVIGTVERDGFRFETGANSIVDGASGLDALLHELGVQSERVDASPVAAHRYVVKSGRLVALPASPRALLATPLFSLRAKLRLLREPFVPAARDADESIAAFAQRRFGAEVLDYAIDPFVSGVHAGDPARLSMRAAFPRLHALEQEHGSVLRGQLASVRHRRAEGAGPLARTSFSFRSGMRALPDALAAKLVAYRRNVRVLDIERAGDGYALRTDSASTLLARTIVVTTPAFAAAEIVEAIAPDAARAMRAIRYAPVAVVASAYRRSDVAHDLQGFGFLVPARERRRILGTLFSSSLFPQRAPQDHVLLTTFVGGARDPEAASMTDGSLDAIVSEELEALLGARDRLWTSVVRWPRAIPQYEIGHIERIAQVDAASEPFSGLHYCASWRDGTAVGERVARAMSVAARVSEELAAN